MNEEKIEVDKFKKLINEMYRGFPNWAYHEMVEDVVKTKEMQDALEDAKFLIKGQPTISYGKERNQWMLGPNALPLVSAWKTEEFSKKTVELNKKIRTLTIWVIVVASISFIANFITFLIKWTS